MMEEKNMFYDNASPPHNEEVKKNLMISAICEKMNLSQDTLRYYEKIGLIPKIMKNAGGFREYTEQDCQRISMIKWMRSAGISIETLTQYIDMARKGDQTLDARKTLLLELRNQLNVKIDGLQATLSFLDDIIENYEVCVAASESRLFNNDDL